MNKATMESKRSEDSDDIKIEKVIIKRQITLLHGVAIIVGIIIGSGIFVSPVGILKEVKSVGFSLVMWVLCGIYNTLCAICYAELGTTIPESGGEYIYIKRAFGDIPAFICLWINFLLICPVGIAASALIFSLYILKPVFPDCDIPEEGLALIAACIFCLLIAVNCHDVKWAAKVQVVITASKLIALAIIIIIGMYYIIGKAMHWILSKEPECEEMPALLIEDQLTSEEYMNAQCKSSYLRDKLVISSENVIKTAWMTTGQRENSLWAAVRKLRITASNFGQVIGAIRRNRLTLSLKKRLLSAYNLEKRPSIQWGLTHEKVAIDSYCKLSEVSVLQTGETENFKNAFEGSDYRAGAIAISFYSGFWAYSGWSYLNFLVGELVEPNKNLPRAIMISMTLVIVTYLIANVAYLGVLSPGEMLQSPAVAVTFGDYSMGIMAWVMPVLIAISVCGTMNGCALSMSRLFFVGAQNKQFPTFMSMIDMKRMTPSPSLLVILILTMLYVSSKDIFFLIEMEGFGFASVLTMVFAGQVYLRYKEPSIPRPIRVHIALPISLFLISLGIVILTFYQKPKESFMALGLVAIGLFLYFIGTWKQKPKEITDKINSFNILIQKLLIVIPPDNADEVDWE